MLIMLVKIYDTSNVLFQKTKNKIRAWYWKAKIDRNGGHVGKHLIPRERSYLSLDKQGQILIGNNVTIAKEVEIFVGPKARLTLGDGVFIGRGSLIACNQEITIGTKTQIAHQVTIIDTDHKFNNTDHKFNNPNSPIAEQGAECSPIYIGENTWIGAASIVLRGVKIGKNSVIGAGTVVTKDVQAFSTSVGNPNKELSKRT